MANLVYEKLADVPDTLRDYAKEADGKYTVKVAPAEKITEFRDNNVKLSQERDQLSQTLTRYEAVTGVPLTELSKLDDFAKALEGLRDTKKRVDDGTLIENTTLEEAASQRVTDVTNAFKLQLADMAKERDLHKERGTKAEQKANQMQIENAVRLVAMDPDVGMVEQAVRYVMPDAFTVFRVGEDGKITPRTQEGTIIYGADGVNPMTIKEWLLKQRDASDASFMFKNSKGGGASGAGDKVAGRLTQAELATMTPQQKMIYARKNGLL